MLPAKGTSFKDHSGISVGPSEGGTVIGFLKGVRVFTKVPPLLLDNRGIGFEIQLTDPDWNALPQAGEELSLWIHPIFQDNAALLFGFLDPSSRECFRLLLKVSGVGPKLALKMLSQVTIGQLIEWVEQKNKKAIQKLPGVGPKLAGKLLLELEEQRGKLQSLYHAVASPPPSWAPQMQEALSALEALGYTPTPDLTALAQRLLHADPACSTASLVRALLQSLDPIHKGNFL